MQAAGKYQWQQGTQQWELKLPKTLQLLVLLFIYEFLTVLSVADAHTSSALWMQHRAYDAAVDFSKADPQYTTKGLPTWDIINGNNISMAYHTGAHLQQLVTAMHAFGALAKTDKTVAVRYFQQDTAMAMWPLCDLECSFIWWSGKVIGQRCQGAPSHGTPLQRRTRMVSNSHMPCKLCPTGQFVCQVAGCVGWL